jgi:GNAT superfamily N-acetyltransferase
VNASSLLKWESINTRLFALEPYDLWLVNLVGWTPGAQSDSHGSLTFHFGDEAELARVLIDPNLGIPPRDRPYYKCLLARGNRFLVAKLDGKTVFHCWAVFDYKRMWDQWLRLHEGESYVTRCFTHPGYRGNGVYRQALTYLLGVLQADGYRTAYLDIARQNVASWRCAASVGGKVLESGLTLVRVFDANRTFFRGPLAYRVGRQEPVGWRQSLQQMALPELSAP